MFREVAVVRLEKWLGQFVSSVVTCVDQFQFDNLFVDKVSDIVAPEVIMLVGDKVAIYSTLVGRADSVTNCM